VANDVLHRVAALEDSEFTPTVRLSV